MLILRGSETVCRCPRRDTDDPPAPTLDGEQSETASTRRHVVSLPEGSYEIHHERTARVREEAPTRHPQNSRDDVELSQWQRCVSRVGADDRRTTYVTYLNGSTLLLRLRRTSRAATPGFGRLRDVFRGEQAGATGEAFQEVTDVDSKRRREALRGDEVDRLAGFDGLEVAKCKSAVLHLRLRPALSATQFPDPIAEKDEEPFVFAGRHTGRLGHRPFHKNARS